ncbi:hypothetical protein WA026_015848 [Henosepilachna vigintioctopunctata]|uniref:Uncharacterized protein n=1 Tax=Henosepilachna vigintioctopunctata TaxID=420089 RepID=A0AAW1V228_9CUCU
MLIDSKRSSVYPSNRKISCFRQALNPSTLSIEPNDQSEVLHFGSGKDTPYPENQYENLPIPEGFHFKQECHENDGDVDYRMESYQGEQFHPFEMFIYSLNKPPI